VSGTFTRNGAEYDLLAAPLNNGTNSTQGGYNFDAQPPPIQSGVFQLQVDRLGLRLAVEENYVFQGVIGSVVFAGEQVPPNNIGMRPTNNYSETAPNDYIRGSKLNVSSTRLGLSLDLVRNPFLRAGIDFDYSVSPVTFNDSKQGYIVDTAPAYYDPNFLQPGQFSGIPVYALTGNQFYGSANPITIGLHMYAIPGRIREIPITAQAKIEFPMPFMTSVFSVPNPANIFQWEVLVGARPAVWDASLLGLSTFSVGIEAGFKYVDLNATFLGSKGTSNNMGPSPSASLKARWQGAFFQIGMYY
jgi:hypothetical protein